MKTVNLKLNQAMREVLLLKIHSCGDERGGFFASSCGIVVDMNEQSCQKWLEMNSWSTLKGVSIEN
jgi:hypothetical protein